MAGVVERGSRGVRRLACPGGRARTVGDSATLGCGATRAIRTNLKAYLSRFRLKCVHKQLREWPGPILHCPAGSARSPGWNAAALPTGLSAMPRLHGGGSTPSGEVGPEAQGRVGAPVDAASLRESVPRIPTGACRGQRPIGPNALRGWSKGATGLCDGKLARGRRGPREAAYGNALLAKVQRWTPVNFKSGLGFRLRGWWLSGRGDRWTRCGRPRSGGPRPE
jgi:hypothetical protein